MRYHHVAISAVRLDLGLLQNAPCCVSTRQKNSHLCTVSSGFVSSRSLPDTFCNSPDLDALLLGLRSPTTAHHVKDNLKQVLSYLCINKETKRLLSPDESLVRVRCISAFVRQKIADRPELESEYLLRHWLFCDAIRKSQSLPVVGLLTPEDLGLGPYFLKRERVCVSGKEKPIVALRGVPFVLSSTRTLGLGSFGVVKSAVFDAVEVAIKRTVIGSSLYDFHGLLDAVGEAQGLLQLQHPNVVRCFGFFTYGDGKSAKSEGARVSDCADVTKFAMVLERVRPMHPSVLAKLSIEDVVTFFGGLATGLAFLHQQGMIHGDFKTINSGMGLDGIPKLLDFGFVESTAVRDMAALRYAPEQLGGTYPSPEAIAQRAACLIRPCDGRHGSQFAMKDFSTDRRYQTTTPPYSYVPIPDFSGLDLTKLDVFSFGVSFYDAIKVNWLGENNDAWPSYMTRHSNLNFLRDKVIMNGSRTRWAPNPVFDFLDTAILFSDIHGLLSPAFSGLFDVVRGCLSENPDERWSMGRVLEGLNRPVLGVCLSVGGSSLVEKETVSLSDLPSVQSDELSQESPWSIISTSLEDSDEWDLCDA